MTDSPGTTPTQSRVIWLTLLVSSTALVLLRLHAFALPMETDECNYAYTAARLLDGDRLYIDVWDHQPPGIFVLFAILSRVVGNTDLVFRGFAIVASLASLFLIHRITRRAHGPFFAAITTAVFALTSSDPGTAGDGCNREIYLNLCALAALLAITHPRLTTRHTLLAGLALGIGSTIKTVLAAHWLTLAVWIIANRRKPNPNAPSTKSTIVAFAAGPFAVWTTVLAYFALTQRATPFLDAVFGYNLGYSGLDRGFAARFTNFFNPVFNVFGSAAPLWAITILALPTLLILLRRRLTTPDGAILAYALGAFLAVCLPGRFWPHYYYLLLPPAILVCVHGIALLHQRTTHPTLRHTVSALTLIWIAVIAAFQANHYALLNPADITSPHPVYRYRQAWSHAQGRRIAELTDPGDTIFVWGNDVGIYYYAQRKCASRYTMIGALSQDARGAKQRQRILIEELTNHRPRLVLLVEPEFPELKAFLQQNYQLASPRGVDRDDRNPEKIIMVALTDVDHPVNPIDWEWSDAQ